MKLLLASGETMPEVYTDPGYSKLNSWAISTSNLSSDFIENWGWGEVVEDGIGVAYSVRKDDLRFNVCARVGMKVDTFVANLRAALLDMQSLYAAPAAKL
jgi:hypothetical protein